MKQLYEYIQNNYSQNEPILVSELECAGYTKNNIRQQIMLLANSGKLCRYDTGVYYIPGKSIFKSGTSLNQNQVIEKKYFYETNERCGYYSGLTFANKIGLTTQVPNTYEVTTNKATKDYRVTNIASSKIVIRRPRVMISNDNYKVLQFLDLLKDVELYSELDIDKAGKIIMNYAEKSKITFSQMADFLQYYPDSIYKNMYKVGILNGISS